MREKRDALFHVIIDIHVTMMKLTYKQILKSVDVFIIKKLLKFFFLFFHLNRSQKMYVVNIKVNWLNFYIVGIQD